MADYPEWVLKYKEKGTYVNKVGNHYYLYKAHSEREKGTGKIKRVCDGYLGKITEKDGLIPSKGRGKQPEIPEILEFGLSHAVISSTPEILEGMRKTHPKNGTFAYACAVLSFIYGMYSEELYRHSYVSLSFPGLSFHPPLSPSVLVAISRGDRMLTDRMKKIFGNDPAAVRAYLSCVHLLRYNDGREFIVKPDAAAAPVSEKYGISWEETAWQK